MIDYSPYMDLLDLPACQPELKDAILKEGIKL
jgi:hypothetical protein